MIKSLIWNIRGTRSQGAFDRLSQLKRSEKLVFIALMEPLCQNSTLRSFKRRLGLDFAYANCINKVWIFCEGYLNFSIVEDVSQQVTVKVSINDDPIFLTLVYAKCKAHLREPLWDNLKTIASGMNSPWMVARDFNIITDPEEKKGGKIHNMSKSLPFIHCIMDCGLMDMDYSGSPFTWCNGWAPKNRIWARLDRALGNNDWLQKFSDTTVTHLVRTGSDHAPLLISFFNTLQEPQKYFRFLDLWTGHEGFMDIVEQAWNIQVVGGPMWKLHLKLKNVCKMLSNWSKNSLGNIFDKTKELQSKLEYIEQNSLIDNSEENRMELNHINAQLIRHIKTEEAFWRQKSGLKWFTDGDNNTRFLRSVINSRRRRLFLKRIKKQDGTWIEGNEDIATEAIHFFSKSIYY
ncbi:uncharacterized protein [Nicotiana sylvestris]|uniref:uncharacterized protein n=1 Tax=Nicotiana sylvestris TaxID=4096 RepID=UPI00388CAB68